MVKSRLLLPLAGFLVVAVIIMQASQLSSLTDQVSDLEKQVEASDSRTRAALELSEQAAAALPEESAHIAEGLRLRARLLQGGDPRLLEPQSHPAILALFDELL